MSKKYKMHEVTKKEAKKIEDLYGIPADALEGCYVLVNKKGKPFTENKQVVFFSGSVDGRTKAEQTLLQAAEACMFFKQKAKQEEISFKIPKMEDLLIGNLDSKKVKWPEKEAAIVKTYPCFLRSAELGSLVEEVESVFNDLNELKSSVSELLESYEAGCVMVTRNEKENEFDEIDEYADESEYEEDEEAFDEDEYEDDEYDDIDEFENERY